MEIWRYEQSKVAFAITMQDYKHESQALSHI